jgi:CDP-4-dehydro-6-deoxyglucose reductase, E1
MRIKLMDNSIEREELTAMMGCMISGEYTHGKVVEEFEKKFAEWNGSKYAVMVNSGSSANLLIITLLKERYGLMDGDEVLVPAATWPTTVYPVIQNNLVPVFCDADESFNMSLDSIKRMTSEKTKALFLVHLLGQPANLKEIIKFCEERKIVLIEDCCESLGAMVNGQKVGNFGVMGSFSFYFGHHLTTIEGGMITTNDIGTWDLLKSIRSHGWVRNSLRTKEHEKDHVSLDFVFDSLGYNLRSTNLNASIGLEQLKKLENFIRIRKENHRTFIKLMSEKPFAKIQKVNMDETSSFCLALILPNIKMRNLLLTELPKQGIECRTVVAGNLLLQPIFAKKLKDRYRKDECKNADQIHHCGLYLPNHQLLDEKHIKYMTDKVTDVLKNYGN